MSHLIIKQRNVSTPLGHSNNGVETATDVWSVVSVEEERLDLAQAVERAAGGKIENDQRTVLCRVSNVWGESCVLVGDESVRVNGALLLGGIRVLEHRDEISVDGQEPLWFSTERLARVERFPGSDQPTECPRCHLEIKPGQLAVRCPASDCRTWVHMDPDEQLPCWQYGNSKTCPCCDEPNTLGETWTWVPDAP